VQKPISSCFPGKIFTPGCWLVFSGLYPPQAGSSQQILSKGPQFIANAGKRTEKATVTLPHSFSIKL